MSENELFLARWSRRKCQAEKTKTAGPAQAASSEGVFGPSIAPELACSSGGNDESVLELTAEELALLPRIEDLTPETDLTQFLRKGVPTGLRNAALRRMWSLDPAIRDYVSEAREYAYDWNVPGGVPGSGPFLATQDVGPMVRRITKGSQQPPNDYRVTTGAAAPDGEPLSQPPEGRSHEQEERSCAPQETSELVSAPTTVVDESIESVSHSQASACDRSDRHAERIRRRHGSAMPT